MAQTFKKTLTVLLILFLIFYMLTQPEEFAAVVRSVVSALQAGFERIVAFFNALLT